MRILRRLSQIAVFILFVFLFLHTEYKDNDILPYAVNVFLRLDPLVAGTAALAGRALISLVWPALILAGMTLILGRFFCGWACPMGAVLDLTRLAAFKKIKARKVPGSWRRYKYFILFFLAASSLFTLQMVFLFDPISVLIRSFTVAVFPAVNMALNALFGPLYNLGPVAKVSEPVYGLLKDHFLAFEQPHYRMAALVGLIFSLILALEFYQRRFWCRNLCPLGALLGLMGRHGLAKRRVSDACISCGKCERECRMGAIKDDFLTTDRGECVECLDCKATCPTKAITFISGEKALGAPFDLSRRGLITSMAVGAMTAPVFMSEGYRKISNPSLIRPPGALAEEKFLARCTRCGECMRVCTVNGLQPAFLQAGFSGLFSPVLEPRLGYCEYNCTLCGQVCPTGAVKRLSADEKKKVKIGLAEFDRSRCIPWKGESDCIVCEEHCPTPEKAIKLREEKVLLESGEERVLKRPHVDEKLCIGCGICENKCPLSGYPGIKVTSRGESRNEGEGLINY